MARTDFLPDWATPPGATLQDIMHIRKMTILDLASQMEWPIDFVGDLLQGKTAITQEIAFLLEKLFGGSKEFWIKREKKYREDVSRLKENENETKYLEWLEKFPIKAMVSRGWITNSSQPKEKVSSLLSFFGISDLSSWESRYSNPQEFLAFKKSEKIKENIFSTIAWIRKGEIEAEHLEISLWNKQKLIESIPEIRALTTESSPAIFITAIREILSKCGVVFTIEKGIPGCHASGVTKFVSNDKALIIQSFRYLSDDHFWFTLFHEIGHLILHSPDKTFIDYDIKSEKNKGLEEQEANRFSENTLIPSQFENDLATVEKTYRGILKLAKKIGIAPGILVGQLQHKKIIPHSYFNKLKQRYAWE